MSTIKKTWEIELVDDLIAAGNENATLSGERAREKAMENLAYPIAKAIKNGGGNIHWVDLLSVSEINSIENPEKDGVYGIKDGGVIVNSDGSLLEVGTNDAVMWNGEKWTTFLHIDLTDYATEEELSSAIAAATTALSDAIASEASMRGAADESISKDLADHEGNKTNPHGVTATQVKAVSYEQQSLSESQKEQVRQNVSIYSKEQVDEFIKNWSGYVVVPYGQQKPDAKDAELGKIYLVQISNDSTVNDKFEEWISDGSAWSLIGERSVNLEGYVNGIKSDTAETFSDASTIVVRKDGSNILTRTASKLWNYIKVKADAVYSAIGHKHGAGDITSGTFGDDRIASASTWNGKYSKPSGGIPYGDLAQSVKTSLDKAESALQSFTETDPTVPAWAKAPERPSYSASDVGAATASHTHKVKINGSEKTINPSSGSVVDLGTYLTSQDISGKEDSSNKVTAWSATTTDAHYPSEKLVKTALDNKVDKVNGKVLSDNNFTTTLKNKLDGIENGAEVNVQSNWTQTDSSKDDYIKNKPTSMPPTAHQHEGSDIKSKVSEATTADSAVIVKGKFTGTTSDDIILRRTANDAVILASTSGNISLRPNGSTKSSGQTTFDGNGNWSGNAATATKATQDESGNNIKASYASSLGTSGNSVILKNKSGTTLNSITVPYATNATSANNYAPTGTIASQFQSVYEVLPSYTLPSSATDVAPVYQYGGAENTGLGVVTSSTLSSSSIPLNAQGGLNLKKSVLAVKVGGVATTTQWYIDINNNGTNANTIYLS